jgi:phosphatidylglycerophosphatase C
MKTAAVFDLDGTISRGDTFLEFLLWKLRRRPGRWPRLPGLALAVCRHKAGLKCNTWLKETFLHGILGGTTLSLLERESERFVTDKARTHLRPRVLQRIQEHKSAGHLTILSTASPDFYVRPLSKTLGMDVVHCSRTTFDSGQCFTGRLDGGNCYGLEKVRRLEALFGTDRVLWRVVSYTDHHSDLPLLLWSDRGVAVSPTMKLKKLIYRLNLSTEIW